ASMGDDGGCGWFPLDPGALNRFLGGPVMTTRFPLVALVALIGAGTAVAADLKVGDPAPDFKLSASDGKTYTLSQFKGKKAVVLAWFPKAFTTGCTIECKSLAANGDKIRAYDVAYFMASVDDVEGGKGNKDFAGFEKY